MGKTLVLTEKPSVARDIARVLGCKSKGEGCIIGPQYIVTWALGHLVTLADPEAYDDRYKRWDMKDLPMLPEKMKLVIIKQSAKQFRNVHVLMKRDDVDSIVIATDAGREGELVARWIMAKAACKKPAKRLWISSQTDKAIREGFQNLRPASEYDNLFYSAQARAEADWLVGINVTRALTCRFNAQLSAGRVQTPTLALIVKREEEIEKFVPKDYYSVRAYFDGFSGIYRDPKGNTRFSDPAFAEKILSETKGSKGTIVSLQKEFKHKAPPAAYDLTELQRDANKKYGYSAKQTLSLMQSLYEYHKVLTYPRTDSRYIPQDVVPTLPERLKAVAYGPYRDVAWKLLRGKINTKYIVNDAKVTDHHAIIPTEEAPDESKMSRDEKNIYDLVVRRFLAVLSEPYEYDEVKLTVRVGKHDFYARGTAVRSPGWKALYQNFAEDEEDDNPDDTAQNLPNLQQGQTVNVRDVRVLNGKTRPPARYTEATLLTAMEHPTGQVDDKQLRAVLESTSGLGTPATRADIIEKLFGNFSIERNGKEIRPTAKGRQLVRIVPEDLRSATLTAKWEQRLQNISCGKENKQKFIGEMRAYATKLVGDVASSEAVYQHENQTKEKCPDCGKFLLEVNGKKGKMLVCPDRECGYRKGLSQT
ncbi:MAG: DNA topoisomerase III, partial [Clostridia bacterium]|nr:DNA topoisomerase III [Clostridia bacterium]